MKGFKNIFLLPILSLVSHYAISSPMQQAADNLASEKAPIKISPEPDYVKNSPNTRVNEYVPAKILDSAYSGVDRRYKISVERLRQQAAEIKTYAVANRCNAEYCFLVDMSLPSGMNRFFIYNLKTDQVVKASLVAHGFGSTSRDGSDDLVFSNNNFSFKTSLGKYKIGAAYNGAYGLAYKLYGLESTNNKAFERAIVLHADTHMPETEVYPSRIFQSAGCPAVSPRFLPVLSNYIKSSKQPILMWIYN
ncbi:MAG: murein L,D-transpeptidase catalytic domain-containing protein [Ferruginibacter sp.]